MNEHILKISTAFSETPGARYYEDGDDSGQEFFDKCLKDAFAKAVAENAVLVVDLDDTEGYATSFLDEAFVRLVQEFGKAKVKKYIRIVSNEEPDWIEEIASYIDEAE
ncbi:STAS-like domain-containing protein [Pedobacter sp. UC225_65]|uniref:STAS-like domain-containing protein n=1 Tax=Pedobacter sp. UC225_65 TaxID=3350173 RepID=UPI0036710116